MQDQNTIARNWRDLIRPKKLEVDTSTLTDTYGKFTCEPLERGYGITRGILEVMERWRHPVSLITKSQLVIRDIDILARLAERGLAKAAISVTSLERRISRVMEPRAAAPHRRLRSDASRDRQRRQRPLPPAHWYASPRCAGDIAARRLSACRTRTPRSG